jgi:hypothetical protein
MLRSLFSTSVLFAVFFLIFISCGTEDDFFPPPDFSTVPEPYNIQNIEPVIPEEGVEIYIHEEGTGSFYLTNRDQASVYITLRTDENDVIFSSFANAQESPNFIQMREAGRYQNVFQYSVFLTYTPGLKVGMLGMREGEKRTVVVSPEMGYGNVSTGNVNAVYRNNTLTYDLLLSRIDPQ